MSWGLSVTAGSDRNITHLRPSHPLSFYISLQTFWTRKPLFWNLVLFSGSGVLSPTHTPTQINLPTLISHIFTHTARFPAYRTTENTHTHMYHLRLFLSLRGDTLVGSSRSTIPSFFILVSSLSFRLPILLHTFSLVLAFSLCLALALSLSLEWQSERTVEANYSSAVLVSVLYKIRAPSAVCKRQTCLLLCESLHSCPASGINFSNHLEYFFVLV